MSLLFKIIRGIHSTLCFSIFGAGALGIGSVIFPFLHLFVRNPDKRRLYYTITVQKAWRFFVFLLGFFRLVRVRISKTDRQKLSALSGTIVIANHPSLIDIVILVSLIKKPTSIVRGALSRNFFVRTIVKNAFISNSLNSEELIAQSKKALFDGYNLIAFPTGTRAPTLKDKPLQHGVFYLSLETRAPILLLNISPSQQILGKNQKWFDVGDRLVTFTITVKQTLFPEKFRRKGKAASRDARRFADYVRDIPCI